MYRLVKLILVALSLITASRTQTSAQIVQSEAAFRMVSVRSEKNSNWVVVDPYRGVSATHGGKWIELITQQPKEYVNSTIHTINVAVWVDVYPRRSGQFRIASTRPIVDSVGKVIGYQRTWRLDFPKAVPTTRVYYEYSAYLYDRWFNPIPYAGFDVIRVY